MGRVQVEAGDDPNFSRGVPFQQESNYSFNLEKGDYPVFPFHWPCYTLLAQALPGTGDVETAIKQVDKDVLYALMRSESRHEDQGCLRLDYGVNAKAKM